MTLEEFCAYLLREDRFIITAHEAPDGDAIGAEIVLYSILEHLKKDVIVLNSDETEEKYAYVDPDTVIRRISPEEELPGDISLRTLIVVDTEPSNIGHLNSRLNETSVKHVLVADHHDYHKGTSYEGLYMPNASSTCEMLYYVQQYLDIPFFPPLTEAMFTGIVYDTGSFIYPKTTAVTFEIAQKLVENGARPNFVYSELYESKSTESLKLRTMVGSTLELHLGNHVAYQYMDGDTLIQSGAKYEESQEIVNIPLQCRNVRVSIFFKDNGEGKTRCSIRTKPEIDCLPIASRYGGGGHPTAAGFRISDPIEEVKREVLDYFTPFFT